MQVFLWPVDPQFVAVPPIISDRFADSMKEIHYTVEEQEI
jgi:hypothetical protein